MWTLKNEAINFNLNITWYYDDVRNYGLLFHGLSYLKKGQLELTNLKRTTDYYYEMWTTKGTTQ